MGAMELSGWWSGLVARFRALLAGAADGSAELGAVDLRRQVVAAISRLSQHDQLGHQVLPPAVALTITAPEAHHALLGRHLADSTFDDEVKATLLNELYQLSRAGIPTWTWTLVDGPGLAVSAVGAGARPLAWLKVRGGDRDGVIAPVAADRRLFTMGRTEMHGEDDHVFNDLQLSASARFVSRRAAALHRDGGRLLLESRDQREDLVVQRANGERTTPARVVSQRVQIAPGDVLLFSDSKTQSIEVLVLGEDPGVHSPQPAGELRST